MTYSNIKTLLRKKGWTGAEIGKALMQGLVYDLIKTNEPHEPLFAEKDLRRMEDSIKDNPIQWNTYACYSSMYRGIVALLNYASGNLQQFYHGKYQYQAPYTNIITGENMLRELDKHPLVMTDTQYNRLKDEAEAKLRSKGTAYAYIVGDIVIYYAHHTDEAPTDIKKAIEACKKEAVTNQRIKDNYTIDNEIGSYSTPPDKLKLTEVDELHLQELVFKGVESLKEYAEEQGEQITDREAEAILQGIECIQSYMVNKDEDLTAPGFTDREKYLFFKLILKNPVIHWEFAEAPKDLNKFDILDSQTVYHYFNKYDLYYDAKANKDKEEPTPEEQFKQFKEDYKGLYKAVEAYIKDNYPKKVSTASKKPLDIVITWGELADSGIKNYSDLVEATDENILEEYRDTPQYRGYSDEQKAKHGIAVIANATEDYTDEEGNYKPAKLDLINLMLSLTGMIKDYEKNKESLYDAYMDNLIIPALRFLFATDTLMDIICNVFGIDQMAEVVKKRHCIKELATEDIPTMNSLLAMINTQVYGDTETKKKKRDFLKATFRTIDLERDILPEQDKVEEVQQSIIKLYKNRDLLNSINLLLPYIETLIGRGVRI